MGEQDLRLIRLVTRQFTDLQGLGLVLAASAQIGFGIVWLSTHDIAIAVAAVVAGVAASVPLGRRVQRYYADRFGRVDSGRPSRWAGVASGLAAPFVASDALRPLGPALLMVVLAGLSARRVLDGWPYRNHHIVAFAAALIAAVVAYQTSPGFDAIVKGLIIVSVAEIPCGFADHALLQRAMTVLNDPERTALGASQNAEGE